MSVAPGTTEIIRLAFVSGCAAASCRPATSMAACARATVTPARRRPITSMKRMPRVSCAAGNSRPRRRHVRIGTHASGLAPSFVPAKRASATPTTVYACSPRAMVRPTSEESPAKRPAQSAWLSTISGEADGASASGEKPRPSAARTPSTAK
jgi:hypothetical protein